MNEDWKPEASESSLLQTDKHMTLSTHQQLLHHERRQSEETHTETHAHAQGRLLGGGGGGGVEGGEQGGASTRSKAWR